MQAVKPSTFSERFKRGLVCQVDWWFAYTSISADTVAACGFPRERITIIQNAIDTQDIDRAKNSLRSEELKVLKTSLGITANKVGLFCGGMYSNKQLDFLIEACIHIHERISDFHMICIGGGPEQYKIEAAAKKYHWLHYVGPKFGADRVPYLMISHAMLMPGLVGLVIVDSFAARVPLFTTDIPIHSPEIAYLETGINGIMTPHSVDAYVSAVVDYLESSAFQSVLKEGCAISAHTYTLNNMINNFSEGIKRCLAL